MVSCPGYSDLGKKAREIFDNDFKVGICNFDLKSKTCTGADLKITGNHDLSTNFFDTLFEYKTKITCGVLSKIKLDSKWNLTHEFEVADRIVRNMKQTVITKIKADEKIQDFTLKNCYVSKYLNSEADFYFKESCPTTVGSLVLGPLTASYPIYAGFTATMEPRNSRPSKMAASLYQKYKDLQLHASVDKNKNLQFSAFHATSVADFAVKVGWNFTEKAMKSQFGFLYKPSALTFIKGKIDNDVNVGLSYGVKVSEGMNIIFSTLIDGKNIDKNHQMGFSLEAIA